KQDTYISEDTDTEKELIDYQGKIFKNIKWRNTKNQEVNNLGLAKRLYIIKEVYELEEFKAKTISEYGMVKMAVDIYKKTGRLDKEELNTIGDRYNLSKVKIGEYSYHDTTKMKNIISGEVLKQYYDIEIEGY